MSSHSNNQELKQRARVKQLPRVDTQHQSTEVSRAARANVCSESFATRAPQQQIRPCPLCRRQQRKQIQNIGGLRANESTPGQAPAAPTYTR